MADSDTDARIKALEQQVQMLSAKLGQVAETQTAAKKEMTMSPEVSKRANTFFDAIKDVEFYGDLNLSVDSSTKGLKKSYPNGTAPVGNVGWQPDISTNISYVGVRGSHALDENTKVVYQLETQLDISATAGTGASTSAQSDQVKGALTSRNSYLGIANSTWGAFKVGKTDAPYKSSTSRMNPFSGMIGDYSAIMGNTGGDNRVEFGTRLDHALWYESPNINGFRVNALVSPGQNRGFENNIQASGESDCTGGNVPGSGGNGTIVDCSDGSYGSAYSASVSYEKGPLYLVGAYELHQRVNRSGDQGGDVNDVGNEYAYKVGAQYTFPTKTTVSAIFEAMRRNIPAYLIEQNERSRNGSWLAVTQELSEKDSVSLGWAHAGKTPGDPGQHNTPVLGVLGTPNANNAANMYTLAYKRQVDKQFSWYANYAATINSAYAHYDLGAGGRGVTTDCHDGNSVANGAPNCYAGGHLQGISLGMNYKF
ncbi:porin [Herminiimonas arsenitoxidans]|uniref:porin n=1 Tax=Herminiimonas arsenitoxidans TaxID=1809410 RepID=UPI001E42DDDF|nr:porin [Herminiimonas arsenitoxidans]